MTRHGISDTPLPMGRPALESSHQIFEIPLVTPIQVKNHVVSQRSGFRIFLKDPTTGVTGTGECTPLPGLHTESVEECLKRWISIEPRIRELRLKYEGFDLRLPGLGLLGLEFSGFPSLEFAIEQALLDLVIQTRPEKVRTSSSTPINALLILDEPSFNKVDEYASYLLESEYKAVKIKIGRHPLKKEIQFIKTLNQSLRQRCQIRLDGNCLFDEAGFRNLVDLLDGESIEYIEEPLELSSGSDLASSRMIYQESPIPIALDESLHAYVEDYKRGISLPKAVSAFVVKPTTLGGIHKTVQTIDLCNQNQLSCVISNAFDPIHTLRALSLLAGLVEKETCMGLDTYRYFSQESIKGQVEFSAGRLHWPP